MDVMHAADAVPAEVHHNTGISGSQAAGQISPSTATALTRLSALQQLRRR
jgi:hypothetical protein